MRGWVSWYGHGVGASWDLISLSTPQPLPYPSIPDAFPWTWVLCHRTPRTGWTGEGPDFFLWVGPVPQRRMADQGDWVGLVQGWCKDILFKVLPLSLISFTYLLNKIPSPLERSLCWTLGTHFLKYNRHKNMGRSRPFSCLRARTPTALYVRAAKIAVGTQAIYFMQGLGCDSICLRGWHVSLLGGCPREEPRRHLENMHAQGGREADFKAS